MYKKLIVIFSLVLLIGLGTFLFSKSPSDPKPEVLVTLTPYKTFADRLVNGEVKVHALVSESEDPHTFSPSTKELMNYFDAKIWFITGEPFEEHMAPVLLKNNPNLKIVDLREQIKLIHGSCCHGHADQDLHFWMSPTAAQQQVSHMAQVLKEIYPEKKELIQQQSNDLDLDFLNLKTKLQNDLSSKQGMTLLVAHPAFSYFTKEFHLHQESVEDGGGDPSPKKLAEILSLIDRENIQTIYTQPQHPTQVMEQIALTKQLQKAEMNPYSAHYFENLSHFGDLLREN